MFTDVWIQVKLKREIDHDELISTFAIYLLRVCCHKIWRCIILFILEHYIDGLMQKRHNSIANAMELHLCCIKPSICLLYVAGLNLKSIWIEICPSHCRLHQIRHSLRSSDLPTWSSDVTKKQMNWPHGQISIWDARWFAMNASWSLYRNSHRSYCRYG